MKRLLLFFIAFISVLDINAQSWQQKGNFSGSFESNSIYYVKDTKIDPFWEKGKDVFATNDYLKLDYTLGNFSTGIQLEAYMPALKGFEIANIENYKKFFIGSKYIQWQDNDFEVRIGNLYEQFGSGIVFRSYEDRTLGFNNSLEGISANYNFNNIINVAGLAGRPRFGSDYLESWFRGADLGFIISELFKSSELFISLEGSYVNRYESIYKDPVLKFDEYFGVSSSNMNMYSSRINLGFKGITLKNEYVKKLTPDIPHTNVIDMAKKGDAFLAELGVNINRFAMLATFRKLSNIGTALSLYETGMFNTMNYLPILTRQYTYSLANLNPYKMPEIGEIGGQADLYYSIKGKRVKYWNFHINLSTFYTNKTEMSNNKRLFLWRDLNVDIERKWNKNLKTTILYSNRKWDPMSGAINTKYYSSNIFVIDIASKFDKNLALRTELQYLQSKDYEKDWVAGSFELSIAPKWSIFISDMYNFESKTHYYNGGFSYSKGKSRAQVSYGRTKEGYICSGGICRPTPAFTGLNLLLTTAF